MQTKVVIGRASGIDTIIDTSMPSDMVIVVGVNELVICKNGKILVMSIEEAGAMAGDLWQQIISERLSNARQPL